MPKPAPYHLTWHIEHDHYTLYNHQNIPILTIPPTSTHYIPLLDTLPSFSFRGQSGQFTARKESRQAGHGYWYAYNRVGPKIMKKYLGRTPDLTLTHLEEVAAQLNNTNSSSTVLPKQPTLLFSTRLQVPRPRVQLISRPHLIQQLQQGRERGLILISAPAGFGKTTLLTQWLSHSPTPVAWLSLETQDNDPNCFLSSLIAALQTVHPRLGATSLALLQTGEPLSFETVMMLLVNDLTQNPSQTITLVLDDYHLIEASPVHHALTTLVNHLPANLHLILATRTDPPLPLSRLRAHGHILELRAPALRFSLSESTAFLQSTMHLSLSTTHLTTLQNRTEGWIAGLQIAALALSNHPDPSTILSTFNGNHRFVLDYLSEEVLSRQPASLQSFLLHTAILERLSASLCAAVTGEPASQTILETLDQANLFLISLDEQRTWYRYHHLFAEVLINRLHHSQPTMVPELHRRASIWYEEHAFLNEAVHHALAAHDYQRVAHLLEHTGLSLTSSGQHQTVLNWLKQLPTQLIHTHPLLSLLSAMGHTFSRQFDQAETHLLAAESCLPSNPSNEHDQIILGGIAYCRAELTSLSSHNLADSVTLARRALSLLPETPDAAPLRAGALMYAARAYQLTGDVTSPNEQSVLAAMSLAPAFGPLGRLRLTNQLARLRHLQGRLTEALTLYEQLSPIAEDFRASGASAFFYLNWSHLLREHNQLPKAAHILAKGREAMQTGIFLEPITILLSYGTQARLHQAQGNSPDALSTINELVQLTERNHCPAPLQALAKALQAQILLAQGDLDSALTWANTSGLSTSDQVSYPRELEYLIFARIHIAALQQHTHTSTHLDNILHLLSRLLTDAQQKARISSIIEILILRSLALHTKRDQSSALTTLARALTLAADKGYTRLFLDEGTPLLTLLHLAQQRHIAPDHITLLLSASQTLATLPTLNSHTLPEPLTQREHEVLHLLASGATNAEIAQTLILSLGTVKKYVSNITSKLGAQNRTQAVIHAQSLHLL